MISPFLWLAAVYGAPTVYLRATRPWIVSRAAPSRPDARSWIWLDEMLEEMLEEM